MTDHLTPNGRSRVMAAIRSKDTKPELLLRATLRRRGVVGYRTHVRSLPGTPDVAFTRWKLACFCDGAFWHGHPDHFRPERASEYWQQKILKTQARDAAADSRLQEADWRVLRFWDFAVLGDPDLVVDQVVEHLRRAGWPG